MTVFIIFLVHIHRERERDSEAYLSELTFKQLFVIFFLEFFNHDGAGTASSVADGSHASLPLLKGVSQMKGNSGTR